MCSYSRSSLGVAPLGMSSPSVRARARSFTLAAPGHRVVGASLESRRCGGTPVLIFLSDNGRASAYIPPVATGKLSHAKATASTDPAFPRIRRDRAAQGGRVPRAAGCVFAAAAADPDLRLRPQAPPAHHAHLVDAPASRVRPVPLPALRIARAASAFPPAPSVRANAPAAALNAKTKRGSARALPLLVSGGSCRIRTYDLRIKSPLLYQLS